MIGVVASRLAGQRLSGRAANGAAHCLMPPLPSGVLVTRPEPGASDTAARVAALGFAPILAPVLRIRAIPAHLPAASAVAAVLVTSGNAIDALPPAYHSARLLTVGDATAARARAAGFGQIFSAAGDAEALAALVAREVAPRAGHAAAGFRARPGTGTGRRRCARPAIACHPPGGLRRHARPATSPPPPSPLCAPARFVPHCSSPPRPRAISSAWRIVRAGRDAPPRRGHLYRPARRRGIRGVTLARHSRRRPAHPGRDARTAAMTEPEARPHADPAPAAPEPPAPAVPAPPRGP